MKIWQILKIFLFAFSSSSSTGLYTAGTYNECMFPKIRDACFYKSETKEIIYFPIEFPQYLPSHTNTQTETKSVCERMKCVWGVEEQTEGALYWTEHVTTLVCINIL